MSNTPTGDLTRQGLFDVTRQLLQQSTLSELASCLARLVKQGALADRVTILLCDPVQQRVSVYGSDQHGNSLQCDDHSLLAEGLIRQLASHPQPLICNRQTFTDNWPDISDLHCYAALSHYCLLPLSTAGDITGGCEFIRDRPGNWSEKELARLQTLTQLTGLVIGQIHSRLTLSRERDDFRILVAVTNAVLAKLDLTELISEVAREIHCHFTLDSVTIALRSNSASRLMLYSTHFTESGSPLHDQREIAESGTLLEQVFRSGEMLLTPLCEDATLASCNPVLPDMWLNRPHTLCLLPLTFGNKMAGVLQLVRCGHSGFSPADLNLLRQIAERIAIAVDNALAYQEIHRLKESLMNENLLLTEQINNVSSDFGEIIGRGEAMSVVLKQAEMVAGSDSTVLILGETGTGKELIARAIHQLSERNSRRMVKLNCAAMPAGLLESELFGHERGAFTGATTQRIGRFELADKSSLFLDEVGDMPPELQPKLLRVLQEQEFERLGSNKLHQVNVRLIAATNRNLKEMVDNREFRSDLYYRLNVFPITLPPLRERPEDIPLLVKFFTFKIARRLNRNIDSIPAETLRALSRMEWPGNVRELENFIERAVLLTRGTVLRVSLPEMTSSPLTQHRHTSRSVSESHQDEYQRILQVLKEANGVIAGPRGAAQRLGLKRTTLISRMKRLGIDKNAL